MNLTHHLGKKKYCATCKKPFYDLNRSSPSCPGCGTVYKEVKPPKPSQAPAPYPETEEDLETFPLWDDGSEEPEDISFL